MTNHTELEVCDNHNDFSQNVKDSNLNVITASRFDADVKSEQSYVIMNDNSQAMDADDLTQCASDNSNDCDM